jgi:hypothetical protein
MDVVERMRALWDRIAEENPPDAPVETLDRLFVEEAMEDEEMRGKLLAEIVKVVAN